jgi:hypothetical protein
MPTDQARQHLDHADQQAASVAVLRGRQDAARQKQVEDSGAFGRTPARDAKELRLVGYGPAADALSDAEDNRHAGAIELVPQRRTHPAVRDKPRRHRLELDRDAVAVQPFAVEVRPSASGVWDRLFHSSLLGRLFRRLSRQEAAKEALEEETGRSRTLHPACLRDEAKVRRRDGCLDPEIVTDDHGHGHAHGHVDRVP